MMSLRDRPTADCRGPDGLPTRHVGRRIEPQRLVDDGLRVLECRHVVRRGGSLAEDVRELLFETPPGLGMPVKEQERPGQSDRGRLVTRQQEGHDFVADLPLRHADAALVTGEQQHGQ